MQNKKYEEFHISSKVQQTVINPGNFTYKIILSVIGEYISPHKDVLDIGCGAGVLSMFIATKGAKVTGIDISKKAIGVCKESARKMGLLKHAKFEIMDFPVKIPVKTYDFIVCCEVIEHLANDTLALKKILQLLKPKGIAVISTPSSNAPLFRLGLARSFDRRVGHLRRYTVKNLVKKCQDAGFKVIDTRKTEGIIRNFLFLNPHAGKLVKYIKYFVVDIVTLFDNMSLKLFGESQIFVIVQKI